MELESLIESAAGGGASDLHLEAGMSPAVRVRGALQVSGDAVQPRALAEIARRLIGEEQWRVFLERRSFDLSKTSAASAAGSTFCKPRAAWAWPSGCQLISSHGGKTQSASRPQKARQKHAWPGFGERPDRQRQIFDPGGLI